jgi:hypothetical protein
MSSMLKRKQCKYMKMKKGKIEQKNKLSEGKKSTFSKEKGRGRSECKKRERER